MTILLRLAGYGLRHKLSLAGGYAALVLYSLTFMLIPRLLGTAIDEAVASGLQSRLLLLALAIVGIGVLSALFGYLKEYLLEMVHHRVAFDLRNDFYKKVQSLSFGFHDRQQTGDLMSRATSDVDAVKQLSWSFAHAAYLAAFVSGVIVLMMLMSWKLGLVCGAFAAVALWRSFAVVPTMLRTWHAAQDEIGQMTRVVQEALVGMRVVKGFASARFEQRKFAASASSVRELLTVAGLISNSRKALSGLIVNAAIVTVLWIGAREVAAGSLSAGEAAAFVLYMGVLGGNIFWAGFMVTSFTRGMAAGRRLVEVLDAESPVAERDDAVELPRARGHVRFENVSLAYGADAPAVHGIDFEARPGELVALLGAPGSGKSTIVHMVPRFYDATGGRVLLDGVDVRDATLDSLRRNVGIVLQDPFAFAATIRDNIAYGADDPSMDEIARAARVAQLHDFIVGLPDGYETWVGERGITLSGGQRQRLAIARTILLDPPILILDDSTSSVDVGTEYQIQKALAEVVKGRTTFVIAHRLSTIRNADKILVLDRGRIVERGTHDGLLTQDGYYRRIHDLQLAPRQAGSLDEAYQAVREGE